MSKNLLIPIQLFCRIIELLNYWDVSNCDPVIQLEHFEILRLLDLKKRKLALRDDYANLICADNDNDRHDARISYLQNKSWLRRYEHHNRF